MPSTSTLRNAPSPTGNLFAGQHDTQKQRPPPSKPIPITFPFLDPPEPSTAAPPARWKKPTTGVSARFLSLKKPSDVNKDTLTLLNVTFEPDCDFETLLSSLSNNAQSHIPPKSWLDPPESSEQTSSAATLLNNGRKAPEQRDFYIRVRELGFKNSDAFSTLTRKGNDGQAPLRLAHFRKYWEGLDNMAYYWDNSLDEYLPPAAGALDEGRDVVLTSLSGEGDGVNEDTKSQTKPPWSVKTDSASGTFGEEEPRKKAKTAAVNDEADTKPLTSNGIDNGFMATYTSSISPAQVLPARTAPSRNSWATNTEPHSKPVDLSSGSYRGYRIGNGAEMPDQYRVDCVRAFLEPIAWAFGVTLAQHRRPPVLTLGNVRFPVRMSSVAWRSPQDRMKVRQGWMEGPVLGVQCRADVNFGANRSLEAESILDAVRELGGLLLLAQERARKGAIEKRSGENQWWTIKPRWGGGNKSEADESNGLSVMKGEGKVVERNRDGSKVRRKLTPTEVWKTLKCGNPLWDPKVAYEAIGKDDNVPWDDVFMVSSLNHHIRLLKLRVHPAYLQYITDGKFPDDLPLDTDWCSPKLQRTQWYDLFDIEDRTEAMRGIWGVMSYLMRTTEQRHTDTKMNET